MNQLLTEEALAKREEWEHCAPNAYQHKDLQVLDMIAEIRTLRLFLRRLAETKGNDLAGIAAIMNEAAAHIGPEAQQ